VQIIAVSILLLFTIWVYVYFTGYFLASEVVLDHLPIVLESNTNLISNANLFYKAYYELFYMLYVLIISILLVISWRVEYTYLYKLNFITFITTSTLFTIIFSSILS
jgi:hypothetical protein